MSGWQDGVTIDFLNISEVLEDDCTSGSISGFLVYKDKSLWQDVLQSYWIDFSETETHYKCISEVEDIVFDEDLMSGL